MSENAPKENATAEDAGLLDLKKRSFMRGAMLLLPRWITPNGVTVFRGLLTVPIMAMLSAEHYWYALPVLTVALLLDFVDGALAEARDQKSETGAFLDPLADKIIVCGSLCAMLAALPSAFTWITVAIGILAALLTMTRVIVIWKKELLPHQPAPTMAATAYGKWKLIAEANGVLTAILGLALASNGLMLIAGVALVAALILAKLSLDDQVRKLLPR